MSKAKSRAPANTLTQADRARGNERLSAQRDDRVSRVLDMMRDGVWTGVEGQRVLAKEWGVCLDAVQDYAREAYAITRKLCSLDPDQRADAAARFMATLEHHRTTALDREGVTKDGQTYDNPDMAGANRAIELQMRLTGVLDAGVKIDVTVQASQLSDDALDAEFIQALSAMPEERRRGILSAVMRSGAIDAVETTEARPMLAERSGDDGSGGER